MQKRVSKNAWTKGQWTAQFLRAYKRLNHEEAYWTKHNIIEKHVFEEMRRHLNALHSVFNCYARGEASKFQLLTALSYYNHCGRYPLERELEAWSRHNYTVDLNNVNAI